jgi:enamine deaminase RidA (YjgF/YER057c/UK114 family)
MWSIWAGSPPIKPDGKFATGKVGIDVTLDEAYQHARLVGLELLAVMRHELGSLDKVVRVGRVFGMVNAAPNFTDHPKVINSCSDLFVQVLGDRGRHARCAVGMASLPFNISVEIEAVIEVAWLSKTVHGTFAACADWFCARRRTIMARKYSKKASAKVERAMKERNAGTLRSGRSGRKVTSRKQAIAIGLSEARAAGAKVLKRTSTAKRGRLVKKRRAKR